MLDKPKADFDAIIELVNKSPAPLQEMAFECAKNGDQVVRLFTAPAELFVVQYVGPVAEMLIKDVQGSWTVKIALGSCTPTGSCDVWSPESNRPTSRSSSPRARDARLSAAERERSANADGSKHIEAGEHPDVCRDQDKRLRRGEGFRRRGAIAPRAAQLSAAAPGRSTRVARPSGAWSGTAATRGRGHADRSAAELRPGEERVSVLWRNCVPGAAAWQGSWAPET